MSICVIAGPCPAQVSAFQGFTLKTWILATWCEDSRVTEGWRALGFLPQHPQLRAGGSGKRLTALSLSATRQTGREVPPSRPSGGRAG